MADFYNPYEAVDHYAGINLPHWQQGEVTAFVTWRLADSLPAEKLVQLRRERELWLAKNKQPWDTRQADEYRELFSTRIESWLDAGPGSSLLRNSALRQIVCDGLSYFNGERYRLDSFVIMPNHVHVLFQPMSGRQLRDILYSWKSYTAKQINIKRHHSGVVWANDYWDRLIRSEAHLRACRRYIQRNPVVAKLGADEYSLYPQG